MDRSNVTLRVEITFPTGLAENRYWQCDNVNIDGQQLTQINMQRDLKLGFSKDILEYHTVDQCLIDFINFFAYFFFYKFRHHKVCYLHIFIYFIYVLNVLNMYFNLLLFLQMSFITSITDINIDNNNNTQPNSNMILGFFRFLYCEKAKF